MSATLEVVVDSRPLKLECQIGDVEMSTCWPGGSDTLTWVPGSDPVRRLTGNLVAQGFFGPAPVFAGTLTEPDASQDELTVMGAWNEAADFEALDAAGDATTNVNAAIDAAIARGLNWTRSASFDSPTTVDTDVSQSPLMLNDLLDSWTEQSGQRLMVDPYRRAFPKADDTVPTYQTLPLNGGLGYALDNYASTLDGRYYNGTSYASVIVSGDTTHGYKEAIVDLTPRGTLTAAKARAILTNLLALGRAVPQWTAGIELSYGELLNMGGTKVALETAAAGTVLRIPGGYELAQRLNGQMYLDVPVGRTSLAGGILTIQPGDVVIGNLADAITAALSKKK